MCFYNEHPTEDDYSFSRVGQVIVVVFISLTQGVVTYHMTSSFLSKGACLDNNHSHFILVDDGREGKYGGEIPFRASLQNCITTKKISRSELIYLKYKSDVALIVRELKVKVEKKISPARTERGGLGLGFFSSQICIKSSQIECETRGEQKRIGKKK